MAYYGAERLWQNVARLRRTDYHIRVGRAFYLDAGGARVTRQVRQQMVHEIMVEMAALLPPAYRGHYADLMSTPHTYLRLMPRDASETQSVRS
jgi:1-acyl-sn-glycerol-3-phosphate acyltransferase